MVLYTAGSNTTYTSSSTGTVWFSTSGTGATTTTNSTFSNSVTTIPTKLIMPSVDQMDFMGLYDKIDIKLGRARIISFPDGTRIAFAANGSFIIEDKDAKVIYKAARSHDFNPFINASDKLEEFIKFCGEVGVRQGDMLGIPIRHFVQWLVIEAAKADGESVTPALLLPFYGQPRCRSCGRFLSPQLRSDRIEFCRPICLEVHFNRRKTNGQNSTKAKPQARIQAKPQANRAESREQHEVTSNS